MDAAPKEDILLLADEKFDFDLSLSSLSANEDDEVFFGPVGHKERCIAASLSNRTPEQPPGPASGSPGTWSPLTGEKFVEVYREAHLLALQIESLGRREAAQAARPAEPQSQDVERFVQESKLKIHLFEEEQKVAKSPTSLKRETFCVSESSLTTLPLLPPSGAPPSSALSSALPSTSAPTQRTQRPTCTSQPLPAQPSASHLLNQAGPPKRVTSKLQPPRTLAVRGRRPPPSLEKLKKEVTASLPRTNLSSEKESHGAVLPDKPRVPLDASSLPGSMQPGPGKRSLPVPNKMGLKKTLLKPPGSSNSLMKKPSSSGPTLSLASNMRSSPVASKVKSSEISGVPTSSLRALSNISKSSRTGPTMLRQSLPAAPAGASCRQAKGADAAQPMAEQPKAPSTSPLLQPKTPEHGDSRLDPDSISSASSQLNKTASVKRQDSSLNSKTIVVSTPTNLFKIPQFSIGEPLDGATPKFSQAQRLQSWPSDGRVVHSTPVRHPSGPTSRGLPGSMRTPMSARRMSALPTPASRRLSGLPRMTPQSMPRPMVSPLCVPARRLSSEPRKRCAVRAEPAQESGRSTSAEQVGRSLSPPESSPPVVPQALRFSPEKSDFPLPQGSTVGAAQDRAEPHEDLHPSEALLDIGLEQLTITPEAPGQAPADRPLIDFGSTPETNIVPRPSSRPLIDLMMNTPDADSSGVGKPMHPKLGQLIDLGSPLIQLSPEADKENLDSPLLKF
uniref:G2 and S phase-expressed protein 1 n=1 Tax=Jaculus jaculus TaxID=51337 RepID=UPI001E1AF748|nr:G2 and S phase-expressed protein 1 [Jaculus jaculus]